MELSYTQKRAMYEQGYLVLPGVVPPVMVRAARRAINASLGNQGIPPDLLPQFRAQTFCPELRHAPVITDLIHATPVFSLAESLVGPGNLKPVSAGQLALRFPKDQDPPRPLKVTGGHLDGIGTDVNGIPKGTFKRGFTMLAVVLLSELRDPFSGNFTIWPGTHRYFENYFQQHDPGSLSQGMPKAADYPHPPVQITGQPGDVVLAHHALVHTAAPNVSPDPRYAAIFRLLHTDIETIGNDALKDIWREWPGLRESVAAEDT